MDFFVCLFAPCALTCLTFRFSFTTLLRFIQDHLTEHLRLTGAIWMNGANKKGNTTTATIIIIKFEFIPVTHFIMVMMMISIHSNFVKFFFLWIFLIILYPAVKNVMLQCVCLCMLWTHGCYVIIIMCSTIEKKNFSS